MTNLQAALKDKAAKTWNERKLYYKVGSTFKGCAFCGEVEQVSENKVRFLTGTNVFRSYRPTQVGWTYRCWDCGATDLRCWANAIDVGREPILGNRDVVREKKLELRNSVAKVREKTDEVEVLRNQLAILEEKLRKRGVKV